MTAPRPTEAIPLFSGQLTIDRLYSHSFSLEGFRDFLRRLRLAEPSFDWQELTDPVSTISYFVFVGNEAPMLTIKDLLARHPHGSREFTFHRQPAHTPQFIPADRRPMIVCLCGSTRFKEEIAEANRKMTMEGKIVLAPGVFGHSGDPITEEDKARLDQLHLAKIDMADEVLVVNPGGYIGTSTAREIEYATKKGKRVIYLHTEEVPCG